LGNPKVQPKETVIEKFDWVEENVKYYERKRRPLFHLIGKKGDFPSYPVVINTTKRGGIRVVEMKRIGSIEGEVFYYDTMSKAFYSGENNLKRKLEGQDRHYHFVVMLWEANTSWHRLAKLMHRHRDIIKKIE
jgi:hypothetical protein